MLVVFFKLPHYRLESLLKGKSVMAPSGQTLK
jgi:hypothetical protein